MSTMEGTNNLLTWIADDNINKKHYVIQLVFYDEGCAKYKFSLILMNEPSPLPPLLSRAVHNVTIVFVIMIVFCNYSAI